MATRHNEKKSRIPKNPSKGAEMYKGLKSARKTTLKEEVRKAGGQSPLGRQKPPL